jgi:hypothetical protein
VIKHLTQEQQKVLCIIVLLLLTGLAVKTWRRAHPKQTSVAQQPIRSEKAPAANGD